MPVVLGSVPSLGSQKKGRKERKRKSSPAMWFILSTERQMRGQGNHIMLRFKGPYSHMGKRK
jgi:hypothetical protein